MLEQLRAWLNGDREYAAGVVLFSQLSENKPLVQLFSKGKTDYCYQRLQEELLHICNRLKSELNGSRGENTPVGQSSTTSIPVTSGTEQSHADNATNTRGVLAFVTTPSIDQDKQGLYDACKAEADKHYKEVMNQRAELFALARPDITIDLNVPDKIQGRSKLAVQVAEGFKHVSALYDKADYVKLHGKLPNEAQTGADEELNVDNLPNHLVKQTLDNLRKNVSKMKKRAQTPERVALLQKHAGNIKKLEARWRSLQPAK